MKRLTAHEKRMKVLLHILDKGEATSTSILNDYVLDVNISAVNVILSQLTQSNYLRYRTAKSSHLRVYQVHPDFMGVLRLAVNRFDAVQVAQPEINPNEFVLGNYVFMTDPHYREMYIVTNILDDGRIELKTGERGYPVPQQCWGMYYGKADGIRHASTHEKLNKRRDD